MAEEIFFNNVSHSYDGVGVLRHVTLKFHKNIITAIIGKSGSGKSTLLQMINGLIIPQQGQINVFGKQINYQQLIQLRLKMGYAVQGTGLFPHMTVFENIALLARVNNYDSNQIESRTRELLQFVDLDEAFLKKYPYQLSGGEQQRVGICRAMILKPAIFLLDEAFGALDPTTRGEIHREFLKLQEAEPRTVVMVTHDLNEAAKLAQNILILNDGIVQQFGTTYEILNSPANSFVRDFIQSQHD